jgi:hypothetical protein
VSQEANTGATGSSGAGLLGFVENMPIIDPASATPGNPGHSYLIYKVLMAVPQLGDGGTSIYTTPCGDGDASCPQPLSADERQRLAGAVVGREMPYPTDPAAPLTGSTSLTLDELENLSFWIAEGAPLPASGTCP